MRSFGRFNQRKPSLNEVANLNGLYRQHARYQGCVGHWIFNEGGGLVLYDISGHDRHGSFVNAPTWDTGPYGAALSFNGSNQLVSMGNVLNMGTNSFTLIAHVKSTQAIAGSNNNGIIYKKSTAAAQDPGYSLTMPNGQFYTRIADGTNVVTNIKGAGYNDGKWHQIISVVTKGVKIESFVDGISIGETAATTIGDIDQPTIGFAIGGLFLVPSTTAFLFSGAIEHVQVYNRPLDLGEVVSKYIDPYLEFEWAYQTLHPRFFSFPQPVPEPALPFINAYYNNMVR